MALAILLCMIAMTVLGIIVQISTVGRPKKPTTPAQAALYTVIAMVHITAYGYLATRV